MKKTFVKLFIGLVFASSSFAAQPPPANEVPSCWMQARERGISEGAYAVFINTDSLDKAALMKVLNLAGHIRHMSASYPDFPVSCGWAGSNNCITVFENLSAGTRDSIRNGQQRSVFVSAQVEHDLEGLLDFPGVEISCVVEPR